LRPQAGISDYTPARYLTIQGFELRFEQHYGSSTNAQVLEHRRQDYFKGNKGNVSHYEVHRFGQLDRVSRVYVLHGYDTFIRDQTRVDLGVPGIYCVHTVRTGLKHAIGKSTGRCANVQNRKPRGINAERFQRMGQFLTAARYEAGLVAEYNLLSFPHLLPCCGSAMRTRQGNLARQYQSASLFHGFCQAGFDHQLVQPHSPARAQDLLPALN